MCFETRGVKLGNTHTERTAPFLDKRHTYGTVRMPCFIIKSEDFNNIMANSTDEIKGKTISCDHVLYLTLTQKRNKNLAANFGRSMTLFNFAGDIDLCCTRRKSHISCCHDPLDNELVVHLIPEYL